jgi:inositol-pentakisphosphate 2-kinase
MISPQKPSENSVLYEDRITRLSDWLRSNTLLPKLEELQRDLDDQGPKVSNVDDIKFLAAMTLRDCTVFVKFFDDRLREPEARIGDLDLKRPGKMAKWQEDENALIDEGWYTGTEAHTQLNNCLLNKESQHLGM